MGMYTVQIIDQDPSKMHLFYRDLRDVGFLFFQAALLGEGPATQILKQPCLGRVALPLGGGQDGCSDNQFFRAFVLWRLSLGAFCISSESQSSSDHIQTSVSEQRDCSLLFTELSRSH